MNYLYGSAAIVLLLLGVEQYGEHRVQVLWDLEKARLETIAKQEKETDRKAIDAINEQHKKDIENAKSKAGRDAVRNYINGLLHSKGDSNQTQSAEGISQSASQCGVSMEVEEFGQRCAQDAMTILRFQEWVQREGLETSD